MNFLEEQGIGLETSGTDSRVEHRTSERSNGVIQQVARSMLIDSSLHSKYWVNAVDTACYVLNRRTSRSTGSTPYSRVYGTAPKINHLVRFGAYGYYLKKEGGHRGGKLEARGWLCRFLGYSNTSLEYLVLDVAKRKTFYVSSTHFFETTPETIEKLPLFTGTRPKQNRRTGNNRWKARRRKQGHEVIRDKSEIGKHNLVGKELSEITTANVLTTERRRKPRQTYKKVKQLLPSPPKKFQDIANHERRMDLEKAYLKEVESMYELGGMEIVRRPSEEEVEILQIMELFNWKFDNLNGEVKAKTRFVVRGDLEKKQYP